MRQITDIQELRALQMGIMDEVHRFCTAHQLRYSLSSGTLIGAVRHGGYIPWDDDLDIYMPRADYERFLATFHDGNNRYRVLDPGKECHYYYTFAKVVDLRTKMVERETEGYEIGVYIDIFPIDYVTDDLKKRARVFKWKKLLYKIRRCKISNSNPLASSLAYWCYRLLPLSVGMVNSLIRRLIIEKAPTKTLCNMTEAGPKIKGCFPAEDMQEMVEIQFEDRTYQAMAGYRDYLTHTYGDYMKLPPEDQRVTHKFEAYML